MTLPYRPAQRPTRQVAGALLTVSFALGLYGRTYGLTALLVLLGWCA